MEKVTFRERLGRERPDLVSPVFYGGCCGCPQDYGYEPPRAGCPMEAWHVPRDDMDRRCSICWGRGMKA